MFIRVEAISGIILACRCPEINTYYTYEREANKNKCFCGHTVVHVNEDDGKLND